MSPPSETRLLRKEAKSVLAFSPKPLAMDHVAFRLEPIAELLHDPGHQQQLLSAILGLGVGIVEEGHGQVAGGLVVAAEELILGPQPNRLKEVGGRFLHGLQPLVGVIEMLLLQERIDVEDEVCGLHDALPDAEHAVHSSS